jgi:hypothetical protein
MDPPIVVVLGMHNSGTSALCAVLQQLGGYIGETDEVKRKDKK